MGDASSWDRVFSFPATPPPAADTPHLPPAPDRLSDEGTPLAKRQVRFASDRAVAPGLLQPVLEEGQVSKAEEQQKVAARSNALTSGGSLNLSQELVLRDCCFKWKRGVRNKQSVGSSSTMGGSSRCARGFWRTDSQTRTVDSDMRSLMSLEDMSDLCQALPIEA
ncbi:TPA: hypothetical protein ACH3X3_015024 [Trebouxia sp. C0006]